MNNMMNATEALRKTNENIAMREEAIKAEMKKWVDTQCADTIMRAVNECRKVCSIRVPERFKVEEVRDMVVGCGYNVTIRYSNRVLDISWFK